MRLVRQIEKLRRAFTSGGQPAFARLHLSGSSEIIERAELLSTGKDYIEIGHGGFVTLIPVRVIDRISVYDDND